ncbi:Rieske 2Fe-2S domain-containing protein [Pseudenhygromyxa sp. WMMC2535]|uniref:QcrA and Rieske domain-containing protein n=1 Tax=Pseudenhygromyxa sp. WMMC2535 TaxID=2712867 RepID=UPI0015547167|nr:Rieske 2Fe-2S domain-containing protein [Pseudenhygromyxa sp. WMMC2535]NVB40283.1 Rieske 2Fe-2S domain-containing protein [Pseudenhygromyxa sp. WMMC2535]
MTDQPDLPKKTSPAEHASDTGDGRRTFLKVGVGAVGAGLAAIVVAPALEATLWPMADDVRVTSGGEEFVIVGKRKAFGAEPVRVDIYADRVDAWNRTRNVKIGSAWVVERDGQLTAYSTVCPHLGCAVDYNAEAGKFACPCHDSTFDLSGAPEPGSPAPRALDSLALEEQSEGKLVAIRYERFKQGVEDKVKV